ncbi:MAG: glycosyltransferase family 4 protein [Bacteroidetes bacterium]|jgi:glycosyltransferase involved in cell wall biosynthesis|nr:glycosyltransferase family 4 protein [Bacteroidota bacterium]MBT4339910.1 glycosyltransferase family 4 protein [Bacteroidota bacterium]MBT5992302.1 glycosyltransferase family 4 protein [Bacteroidota bacterium]MBT7040401.1 glycosyltransferase family 4 protein [Bacteroidota bacterium]
MKIINIVPGFGGTFYCGNCLRDSGFIKTLNSLGHDAMTLPIYLPLSVDNRQAETDVPVFYGAVNLYLKQQFPFLRRMPKGMKNFFNSSWILRYAAKKAGSTRAKGLEEMTVSMLKGHEGYQKEELNQLVDFIASEQPDVVHLSNALLLGLAHKIKNELNIKVVCSLQDEDVWVDAMSNKYQDYVWKLMGYKAKDVDAFVAVSQYFADLMQTKMEIPNEKLHVVPIGVNPDHYKINEPNIEIPTIGYLSRRNKENGFEVLIDAFILLKKNSEFKQTRLKVTGGKTSDDKRFIKKQLKKLEKNNILEDVEFIENFKQENMNDFFKGLTVLSVPVLKGEAFGMYQLESLASGIPIVQPKIGAFPEIIENTNGGVLFDPNYSRTLASKLEEVLSNTEALHIMSINGRKAVEEQYNTNILTERMISIYSKL